MYKKSLNLPTHSRRLPSATRVGIAILSLITTLQAQIAINDGSPLSITHSTGTSLNQPFTVTEGANVLVVTLEDKGANLPEPATLSWNGQTLTRNVQTSYTVTPQRSLAIYHLYNPQPGTANISGTLGGGVTDKWVTAYTLSGVDTDLVPKTGSANTGSDMAGVNGLSINMNGVTSGSWAAVGSQYSNYGTVTISGTGGTATTVSDASHATTAATAGFVAGLSSGTVTFSSAYVPNAGGTPQKSNFAVAVFTPSSSSTAYSPHRFGIKFLGNTTHPVTTTAGAVPMPNWNNIANGTFTTGSIQSGDGTASATLTISGSGSDNTWRSGVYPDGGDLSLVYGYQDAGRNAPATNVISGLTRSAYDVYLYTAGETIRPAGATEYLSNYTINGTTYYTSTKDGRSVLWNMVQGVTVPVNSAEYPTTLVPGHYIRINNVAPVNGAITISANTDALSFRSPLNGIQLIQRGNAPQVLTQPLDHRLYTGGTLQLTVEAQSANAMTYRWRKNGVNLNNGGNISGADTSSLTISSLILGDSGDYDVVVTNNFGSATSEAKHTEVVVMTQADAAFEAWLATYKRIDERGATFITESIDDRQWVWAWQQAFIHWSITDAYNRTRSPDHKRLIYKLQNTFLKQEGNTLTWQDWNDDIQWEVIALSKGYPITGNPLARETSISAWNAVMNRAWDDTFGGGIWQKMPVGNSKTVLSNAPQIIGGLELYKITGDYNYITQCETIYDWVRDNLFIDTPEKAVDGLQVGQLFEGIAYLNDNSANGQTRLMSNNVYNSGLFVQIACGLYEVTGDQQYLNDAVQAANYMVNRQPVMDANNVNNGYFGAEQLVRAVAKLGSLNQNKLWPTYWPWMRHQCAAAWAMRRTDLDITRNRWTSPTPDDIDLKALETHSAFLVQQLTPETLPEYVDWTTQLTGTVIGTTGSFNNNPATTREAALDGDAATHFDAPAANGAWVGYDLGAAGARKVSAVRFHPRNAETDRMVGGVFQGANQADFSDAETLYTVPFQPSQNAYHLIPVTPTQAFRYVRYLSPDGGWGNVCEVEFYAPGKPEAPAEVEVRLYATNSVIDWSPVAGADSYVVKRSTTKHGSYQVVAANLTSTSYTDGNVEPGVDYFYIVSGVSNTMGEGAESSVEEAVGGYPETPVGLNAVSASSSQINLTWTASTGATSYNVKRATVSGGPFTTVQTGVTGTSFNNTALTPSTTYYYVVTAVNNIGETTKSAQSSTTTRPAAPTGLNATVVSSSQINLTWTASTGATSYNVKRAPVSGGPYTTVQNGVTGTSYNNTGLTASTTYYYVVTAVNAGGEGANSSQSVATTRPAPPTGLNAVAASSTQINLTWTASTGATSYNVKRATVSGGPYTTVETDETGTSFNDTGLSVSTLYYYVVSAVNPGGESGNSAQSSTTTRPAPPTGLNAVATSSTQINLTWTASTGSTSYNVKRATVSGGPYTTIASPTGTSYSNTGLTASTTYYYVVTAVNAGGEGANSNQSVATTRPAPPTGLNAVAASSTQINLTWTASTGATSYNVKRATVSGGPYTTIASPTGTSFSNSGLTDSTAYYYVVSAVNSGGESTNSTQSGTTTLATAPTGLNASAVSSSQINLTWTASTGPTGYNVKRSTVSGGPYTTVQTGVMGTGYSNTGLTASTTYYYVVTAVNAGGESANSTQSGVTTLAAAPTGLSASATSSSQINLTWAASTGATSYNVKRATVSGGPYTTVQTGVTGTGFNNTGLAAATGYYYVVSAMNQSGESTNSTQASATTRPAAPTGLSATAASSSQINLTWTASTGATSYNVKRATVSGGPYTTIASPTATSFSNSGLTDATTYYYVLSAVNASGESVNSSQASATTPILLGPLKTRWAHGDIGGVGAAGDAGETNGVYTVIGSGADIWGTADEFQFVHQQITGDCDIRARVLSIENTDPWAKAGVMIRETTAAGSSHAMVVATPGYGVSFQRRLLTDGVSSDTTTAGLIVPHWVRLVRAGNLFTAYRSTDGAIWTNIGTETIAMGATVHAGLAVTSHDDGVSTTAQFDNVSVSGLPSPWQSADIGTVTAAGSVIQSDGTFTVDGSGADIWGTADGFRHVYQTASGDCEIIARVASVENTDPWAKAGVMIRETLDANSRHASILVTPGQGVSFQRRGSTGGTSTSTTSAGLTAPHWVRVVRSGNVFTTSRSTDGTNWTAVGSQTITMSTNVYFGLALTSHSDGTLCTGVIDNVTATP